jgi:toxin ParE1/3/4
VIQLDPAAVEEIHSAAVWYEARRSGLSADLLAEVEQTLELVSSRSATFPRLGGTPPDLIVRRALLDRFPYALIFLALPTGDLRVVAFAHAKRRPGYWLWRVHGESGQ